MNNLIKNILWAPVNHIAILKSEKGSIRSNHWHKKGWHYLYVVSGSLRYYERDLDGKNSKCILVKEGELVFTGPHKVHKVEFLEDTVLLNITPNKNQKEHEEDIVKEEF